MGIVKVTQFTREKKISEGIVKKKDLFCLIEIIDGSALSTQSIGRYAKNSQK